MDSQKPTTVETAGDKPGCASVNGSAAGPSKWEIWPLLMALGFICMAKNNSMAELYLRALTIVALTYSISHRLCRRQNAPGHRAPTP